MGHGNYSVSGNANGTEYDEEEEEEEGEEENEYDESDSFIDAENDHPPTSSFIESDAHRLGSGDMYESESDRSTGTVVDDVEGGHHPIPTGLNYRNTTPYFDDEASEEEDEEEVSGNRTIERWSRKIRKIRKNLTKTQSRRHRLVKLVYNIHSSPPGSKPPAMLHGLPRGLHLNQFLTHPKEEESSPPVRPARSTARRSIHNGTTAHNAITLDDSDEDQPVGPVRRTTQRRRARFSPY
ncbi:Zinc finger RING/FYVE/PHD-type [Penicillium expansum]|nr:Zinc finger RING/FYVE/PHD-type [Penicillium expansum]